MKKLKRKWWLISAIAVFLLIVGAACLLLLHEHKTREQHEDAVFLQRLIASASVEEKMELFLQDYRKQGDNPIVDNTCHVGSYDSLSMDIIHVVPMYGEPKYWMCITQRDRLGTLIHWWKGDVLKCNDQYCVLMWACQRAGRYVASVFGFSTGSNGGDYSDRSFDVILESAESGRYLMTVPWHRNGDFTALFTAGWTAMKALATEGEREQMEADDLKNLRLWE